MATAVMADYDVIKVESDANSDDVIAKAINEDPDLNDIINKLDNAMSLDADHNLHIDYDDDDNDDYEGSSSVNDSDSISTTSSFKENEDQLSNNNKNNNSNISTISVRRNTPELDRRKNGVTSSAKNTVYKSSSSPSPSMTSEKSSPASSNGHRQSSPSKDSLASRDSGSTTSEGVKKKPRSSIRKSLKALKQLTKFADKDDPKKKESRKSFNSEFTAVVVDRLPQVFVVKYLGHREVQGMFGLHHVRRPVDEMVKKVKKEIDTQPQMELPLLYVVVSPKGLDLRGHKRNKVKDGFPPGLLPIDFISYGVQDIKYWRVFTCIVVRELSSRSRLASCHAFLCDSSHNGRKMALALGAAFNVYSKKLMKDGKDHNFQVELRPPDELADAIDAEFEA